MNLTVSRLPLTAEERQRLVLPATVVSLFMCALLVISGLFGGASQSDRQISLGIGAATALYILLLYTLMLPLIDRHAWLNWVIVTVNGACLGAMFVLGPYSPTALPLVFGVCIITVTALISGRAPTYLFIVITALVRMLLSPGTSATDLFGLPVIGALITETVMILSNVIQIQLRRLSTVNNVARSLSSSLETAQVVSLLNTSIQKAFSADTYYVAISQPDESMRLELFFDDGEFYPPITLPLKNTLAGWVASHHTSLLLRNLPKELPSLGIHHRIIGKQRSSISWMGTLMETRGRTIGLVAVASYEPGSFDQNDLELLENIAQQAAMAIDNSYHHTEVEEQSRLDSLTQVYNHGYFLTLLESETERASAQNYPVSLIMLDIDHFKQYNDHYGHLLGDQALTALTETIRGHIKPTDAVGRWGGEEFVVLLPHADAQVAFQVAERIRQSVNSCVLRTRDSKTIPSPTVSQGIAVFPAEASGSYALIDLADQRLYRAKTRGRNEIENSELLTAD